MKEIRFVWVNDETMDIYADADLIVRTNHDDHGWDGMQVAKDTASKIADHLGIETKTEGVPNL